MAAVDQESDAWAARAEAAAAGLDAASRRRIVDASDYGVWFDRTRGKWYVMGQNGLISWHDREIEAECDLIINLGVFDNV